MSVILLIQFKRPHVDNALDTAPERNTCLEKVISVHLMLLKSQVSKVWFNKNPLLVMSGFEPFEPLEKSPSPAARCR